MPTLQGVGPSAVANNEPTNLRQIAPKAVPLGWNEARARKVLAHYGPQSEEDAVAEDEAAAGSNADIVMTVPKPTRGAQSNRDA
jgi:hypothetical protein